MSELNLAADLIDGLCRSIDERRAELVELTADLIRFPTVNPPGEAYRPCAEFIGRRLERRGFAVEYVRAEGTPGDSARWPRINVIARRESGTRGPCVHFNGHIDVVQPGAGWTVEPFAAVVREGKLFGRGACDMKGGLAAAIVAAEALIDSGAQLPGALEISGTVDEESGGYGGVHFLAERGYFSPPRVDHVIIPEPLNVDRVCIGHRGVWWAQIETHGRIAHGSMPFLGDCAVRHMNAVLDRFEAELYPKLAARKTEMPVVPSGARHSTLNINSIHGGLPELEDGALPSPCVPDSCRMVIDRRWLVEEDLDGVKNEIRELLEQLVRERSGFSIQPARCFRGQADIGRSRRAGGEHDSGRHPTHSRTRSAVHLLAGHVRSEAHRSRRQAARLHRLRARHSRPRASTRRVRAHRGPGGVLEGDGACRRVASFKGRMSPHRAP